MSGPGAPRHSFCCCKSVIRSRLAARTFTVALWLLVVGSEPAAALTCPQPDPWFTHVITPVGGAALPPGVSLRVVEPSTEMTFPVDDSARSVIQIRNDSAIPLYILVEAAEFQEQMGYSSISWPVNEPAGLPGHLRTYLKLQSGQSYRWPYNCEVVRCDQVDWEERSVPSIPIADGLWGVSKGYEDRVIRENDRPADVAVPAPQSGVLSMLYDTEMIQVPFVVRYQLNESYDPSAGSEGCPNILVAGLVLTGLVAGLIAAMSYLAIRLVRIVYRGLRRSSV